MPALDLGEMLGETAPFFPAGLRAAEVYLREYDVCVWNPSPAIWHHDLDRVNRLIAAGYEQIPEGNGRLLTVLHGQMSEVLTLALKSMGAEHRSRWVHPEDRKRAEDMPVALAFPLAFDVPPATENETAYYRRWAERLPPPTFGERALVWHNDGWQARSIEQLGENARELQASMATVLRDLVAPSDWYLWSPELDACHDPAEYQRMRQDLQSELLRKRGNERKQVRQALMQLDTLRNQALAIEASMDRREIEGKKWLDAVWEVIKMARVLAALYWDAEQTAGRQVSKRALPEIPNVFDSDGLTVISTMMPVQTILNGYSAAPDGWVPDDAGLPTFRQVTSEHDTILQVRGEGGEQVLDDAGIQALWAQVREYGDNDGDVFLAMLAQYMTAPDDAEGVWITSSQILDYRGIQPIMKRDEHGRMRRAGHRQEDLIEISRCVARQANQWVQLNSMIADEVTAPKRGKKAKKRFSHNSRLTVILEDIRQHELALALGGNPARTLAIAWRFRMGTWLTPFLSGPNRAIGLLCRQSLRYDPYHEQWEKRLARYFMFHVRINVAGGTATIKRTVGKLIDELALPVDERHPQRTRDRFEQALNRLIADGVIDAWQYPKDNASLPARGWLATWRDWSIQIHAAAITQERHARLIASAQQRRERAATLHSLKAERKKRNKDDKESGSGTPQNG